mmetsp:Transcript_272/g.663  ORF Transcript_272/g.663 Transcript_272/m.663 type:complete len:145 (+) Transcript_272:156-590(+)
MRSVVLAFACIAWFVMDLASAFHLMSPSRSTRGGGLRASLKWRRQARSSVSMGPVKDSIEKKLTEALVPSKLDVIDESAGHADHLGAKMEPGKFQQGETHFRIVISSPKFEGLNPVKRHQLIYGLLKEEMESYIHALSISASIG